MQLIYFSAIISALLSRQISISAGPKSAELDWQLIFVFAGLFSIGSILARDHSLRQFRLPSKSANLDQRIDEASRVFHRYRILLQWLCVVATIALMPQVGWLDFVQRWSVGRGWISLDLVACLLPSIVAFSWIEICGFAVETRISSLVQSTEERIDVPDRKLLDHLWCSVKHTWLVVVPFALLSCFLYDAVRFLFPVWSDLQRATTVGILSMGGAMVLAPLVLARNWDAAPLPSSEDNQKILSTWAAVGMAGCPILTWDTQGRLASALMIGVLPRTRRLLLSDRLLKKLSHSELKMIVLHEAAHSRRYHATFRSLPMLVAFLGMILIAWLVDRSGTATDQAVLGTVLLVTAASLLIMIVSLGAIAHWCEYDADREAVNLASRLANESGMGLNGDREKAASDLVSALRKVCHRGEEIRASWLHPSIASRVLGLEKLAHQGMATVHAVSSR
jgi:Zn-dependent protease with chaperone function